MLCSHALSLRRHISSHCVVAGQQLFKQQRGIPQGSTLSTLLCNLYYGYIERKLLYPSIERVISPAESVSAVPAIQSSVQSSASSTDIVPYAVVMRMTDDYLLLTHSRDCAHRFESMLTAELQRWGIAVNSSKVQSNTQPCICGTLAAPDAHSCGCARVLWCGLSIAVQDMQLRVDYTRYTAPFRISDSVAACIRNTTGYARAYSYFVLMRAYLRPKCHALILDGNMNTPHTVAANVYQIAALSLLKLLRVVHCSPQLPQAAEQDLEKLLLSVLLDSLVYLFGLMRNRVESMRRAPPSTVLSTQDSAAIRELQATVWRAERVPGPTDTSGAADLQQLPACVCTSAATRLHVPSGASGLGAQWYGMGAGGQRQRVVHAGSAVALTRAQVHWLALRAYADVLQRRNEPFGRLRTFLGKRLDIDLFRRMRKPLPRSEMSAVLDELM